jgi:hypothetical protein
MGSSQSKTSTLLLAWARNRLKTLSYPPAAQRYGPETKYEDINRNTCDVDGSTILELYQDIVADAGPSPTLEHVSALHFLVLRHTSVIHTFQMLGDT